MADPVFTMKGVTKVYDTGGAKVHALAGVDLELPGGELAVLLGPSGSGKSTLLNILGGLDHVTDGRVWFRDLELTAMRDRELTRYRRDHVGFIFQFYNLVPSLTARENVQLVTDVARDPMPAAEALDSKTGIQVLEALHQINRDFGTATVVITHNADIQKIAHRVIFFQDGRISRIQENTERLAPADISW
ncbi:ABC transporter ATP-binding protein (plasmid) [Leisingera caerulea]|uniref:ABC transporter ATP-binding protein n=1 Tax=Leisingera caerulea TaxID=506591 RepID=UPI0021A6722A|nr:ABC transporter ATP-binding protein [Leisingera caerulea]UWQ52238.1 ABC transporter ATP-binding protein [Leisingera caerulea]